MTDVPRAKPLLYAVLHLGPLALVTKRLALLAQNGLSLRIRGTRHVPRCGSLVIAAAHPSIFDLPSIDIAVKRRSEIVLDERFLEIPVLRSIFRIRGAHPLRRTMLGYDERNVAAFARAAGVARAGGAVLIFPTGWEHRFGSGVARLAAASRAPVLPIASYHVGGDRARPRTLVVVRRAVPAPADDPVARRRFVRKLRRQHRRLGLTRPPVEGAESAFSMALDDARLWRRPSEVIRRSARLARLEGERLTRFLRAARALRRGCERLHCSVGDLRTPPGLRHVLAYLVVAPAGLAGFLLCGSVPLALRLAYAKSPIAGRGARRAVGILIAPVYGVALGALAAVWLGPPGWLLPAAALVGICAAGAARPLHRRVRCLVPVRRHGHRVRRLLAAFDEASR